MKTALLVEMLEEYRGKDLTLYNFKWGNEKNGILEAVLSISDYWDESISMLYFGNEFCEYKIPSIQQVEKAVKLCESEQLEFVLVTPVVTDSGIQRLDEIFAYLQEHKKDIEIIVNDIGILALIKSKYPVLKPVLGRIFDKTSHDARAVVEDLQLYYGKNGLKFAQTPGIISESSLQVYKQYGVQRYEFDLPKVGLILPDRGKFSLYWPYSYLTTGRICMLRSMELDGKEKFLVGQSVCSQSCRKFQVEKRKPQNGYGFEKGKRLTDFYLFQKGNTLFYLNNVEESGLYVKQFDRLVLQI